MTYKAIYSWLTSIRTVPFSWGDTIELAMDPEIVDTATMIVEKLETIGKPIPSLSLGEDDEITIRFKNNETLSYLDLIIYPVHNDERFIYIIHHSVNKHTEKFKHNVFDINTLITYLETIKL